MAVLPGWQDEAYRAAIGVGMAPKDARVFVRKIGAESGGDVTAKSPAGAAGIAQFMPGTAAGFHIDPFNPKQALHASALMDARNLRKYGNWEDALEAYNAGPGAVNTKGPPKYAETRRYVEKILGVAAKQKPVAPGATIAPDVPVPGTAGFTLTPEIMSSLMRYLNESERDAVAGRRPAPIDSVLPVLTQALPVAGGETRDTLGQLAAPGLNPGHLLGAPGKLIGGPGQGTHSYTSGPNNWQSDRAVDIRVPVGTPVYAPFAGVVDAHSYGPLGSGDPRMAGLRINLHGAGNSAYLAHLSKIIAAPGQRVRQGELLGYTGSANGVPHLHFAVQAGDPAAYYR